MNLITFSRRGSMYVMALVVISVLFLLGSFFLWVSGTRKNVAIRLDNHLHGYYIAEAGIERGNRWISDLIRQPLVKAHGKVNKDKLNLLDLETVSTFSKIITESFGQDGEYSVHINILNVNETSFKCHLEPQPSEDIPDELSAFKSDEGTGISMSKYLGGWEGELRIKSTGTVGKGKDKVEVTLETIKSVKIMDLTPPAPDYTLFIHGEAKEYLKTGRFVLSNWEFDGEMGQQLVASIEELSGAAFKAIPPSVKLSLEEMVELVKNFVSVSRDTTQKKLANQVIMHLHPWGKIRTNGSLSVFLPFFEVDDVINYFVDNKYYQRPEVGYPGCYNRLHDRYMSKYTKYEGDVEIYYYELAPYVLRKQYPRQRHKKYTRFSTFRYHPQQNPSEYMPKNLENIIENGKKYAAQNIPKGIRLRGTAEEPIQLDGIIHINGVLDIEGPVRGRGIVLVSGDINVHGSVTYAQEDSLLVLITPKGKINLKCPEAEIHGAVYANSSIQGGTKLRLKGNLVCEKLNRQQSADHTTTIMPEDCEIQYDRNIRNIMAVNVHAAISYADISRRIVPRD